MTSVYCIYPAYAVDPVPIKTKCKVLALHSHLKQQLVAILGTLLQIRLQAVVNILIVLSFKSAHFGSLVNANAVSLMQSQDDLWFQSCLLSECISFAANDLLLVDGECEC